MDPVFTRSVCNLKAAFGPVLELNVYNLYTWDPVFKLNFPNLYAFSEASSDFSLKNQIFFFFFWGGLPNFTSADKRKMPHWYAVPAFVNFF